MKLVLEFLSSRSHAAVVGFLLCVAPTFTQSASIKLMADENTEHGSRFVRDESRSIRFSLASSSRDADVLALLASDPDYLVRSNALANFATPVNVLTAAVDRIVKMSDEDVSDSAFHEFLSDVDVLISNPRLPQDAYLTLYAKARQISQVIPPLGRDVPFEAIIEYGSASGLQEDETFRAWKNALARDELDRSASRVEMLEHDKLLLRKWAVSSRDVPIRTLLTHVQKLLSEPHVSSDLLAHVAMNANLGSKTPEAEQLVQLLLAREHEYVDGSLASNPDLPPAVLRTLALNSRARDKAKTTLWQVYGEKP